MVPSVVKCYLVSLVRQAVCWTGFVQAQPTVLVAGSSMLTESVTYTPRESLNRNRQETKLYIDLLTWPQSKNVSLHIPWGSSAVLPISVCHDFTEHNDHEREDAL